jgi:hypothetical protein
MKQEPDTGRSGGRDCQQLCQDVAKALVERAPQDVVFTMAFVGESRDVLTRFFEGIIREELDRQGVSPKDTLVRPFIDLHAASLRDFVFSGVALSRQFRLQEIERLLGDTTSVTRVDLWDELTRHLTTAVGHFLSQSNEIPALVAQLEEERRTASAPR